MQYLLKTLQNKQMKLFAIGPVEMYERTLKIGGKQVPYFRNQEFSDILLKTKKGLMGLLDGKEDDEMVFLTGSGTAAMEATVINCFDGKDHLIVINGGTFGNRFCELCQLHNISYTPVKVDEGVVLTKEMLENAKHDDECQGKRITGLLVNAHESSTGQLYDLKMLSEFCDENQAYFVVDAISSFLADYISVKDFNIDIVILSSQKALSLAPGLSMVYISKKILDERVYTIPSKSMYLDFKSHLKNGERGQTPFTPAVRIVYELSDIVDMINDIGLDKYIASIEELANDFRNKAKEIGLQIPEYPLSNAATTIIFPNGGAERTHKTLEKEYQIVVNPNGGEDADKKFRVGHIGNHTLNENVEIVDAIKAILG